MITVSSSPYPGQRPGTSGLRQRVSVFQQPHYLENFVQAIFNAVPSLAGATLVVGGDGRYYNRPAIARIAELAAGNGIARLIVGRGGLLSTPAASALIRQRGAAGGLILSASHNPGGPQGDFGIKFNGANGAPASEQTGAAIYAASTAISHYQLAEGACFDLDQLGSAELAGMQVEVIDGVADYADLMASQFDFAAIGELLRSANFEFYFDAMHAITGPYAEEIFCRRLGASRDCLLNDTPREDFGGGHPDPNLAHASELLAAVNGAGEWALGAASDGDGDRNMVVGSGLFINPCDSLAIIAANAALLPGFGGGLRGVARSMPTSRAVDRVAAAQRVSCYETPTGWKFFATLLDGGHINLCGEESFGTGGDHLREKDGLWAVLCWLNIIAARQLSPRAIVYDHWATYGRDFFTRHDYEGLDSAAAVKLLERLQASLAGLAGNRLAGLAVTSAEQFSYTDPVDGARSSGQGIRLCFDDGSRTVVRLSGTGTSGATLRLYYDRHEPDPALHHADPQHALAAVIAASAEWLQLERSVGRAEPDVVT